jgi:hypothetical protein
MAYSSVLKMKAVCSSETCVNFYQTTRHHIQKGSSFHSHLRKGLKYSIVRKYVFRILKSAIVDSVYLDFLLVTLLAKSLQADESGRAGAHGIVRVGDVVPKRAVGFGSGGAERFLTWPTEVSLFAQFVARRDGVTHARWAETNAITTVDGGIKRAWKWTGCM